MTSSNGPKLERGVFPDHWIDGTDPNEPTVQVHRYSERTWIVRQSVHTNYEAPFLYVLAGDDRALLLDTGAGGGVPVRETVDGLIGASFPLVVAHSHAHGDHIADDGQFADRPNTVVVGHKPEDVAKFFGIDDWPVDMTSIDLGGRVLSVIAIPGHEPASITLYDDRTGLLLTGDSVYPGRLYVWDLEVFRASIDRLVAFMADHEVTWVLGTHIEMSAEPGVDFPRGVATHPNERELKLDPKIMYELRDALHAMGDEIRHDVHDDFIVFPRY